jgi:hypothetical protein
MEKNEFLESLKKNSRVEYTDCSDFVEIKDLEFDTKTRISNDAIANSSFETLMRACHHGKNVKHKTRITGYFSVVEGWNVGKRAELKDRYEADIN